MAALASGPGKAARDQKRVPVLDGIRGLCAMAVVVTHVAFATFVLPSSAGPPPAGIWSILAAGQVGAIGPFFVMSGLFLYRPFVRRTLLGVPGPRLGTFFLRRAARLLPAFWLVVAASLLVLNLDSLTGSWDVLRPFLGLHVYDFRWYAGLDVVWTVPTEAQFYLVLPLIAWVTHRIARRATDPAARARRLLIPLLALVALQFGWTGYVHSHYDLWPPQFFYPFGVAGLFAVGMAFAVWTVLAEVAPERKPRFFGLAVRRPGLFWLGAGAAYAINCTQPFAVAGTADWLSPPAALIRSFLLLAFSFLIMVPLVVPGATPRWMTRFLGNAPMRYLGRISYGIYLWHFFVMYIRFESGSVFGKTVPVQMLLGKFGFWELLIPVVVGTIVVASVSYYVLEKPVIRVVERLVKRGQQPKPAAAPAASLPPIEPDERKVA
jgi:peptidoglycan/LPS O-acetylase OafA/YrhL